MEKQLFKPFIPENSKYLILGGFTAKKENNDETYDWYYCSKRNLFWKIIEGVYGIEFLNTLEKKKFFSKLKIAIADSILKCERKLENSSDSNLINCTYNYSDIEKILKNNNIKKIFFTCRLAEKVFKKNFNDIQSKYPKIELITLPSPSPRYALISKDKKISIYKKALPKL